MLLVRWPRRASVTRLGDRARSPDAARAGYLAASNRASVLLVTDAQCDAWLVDLDGTLYKQRWVRLAMAAELLLLGWSALPVLRRFRHEQEAQREELIAGTALAVSHDSPYAAQLARTATALSVPVDRVERIVVDWMFVRPKKWIRRFLNDRLLAELWAFKAQGGKTALVSDYPARRKLEALNAPGLFDVVVASGELNGPRRLKPDPEGYLRAAELLQVEPGRCLVIGDRDDADGAAARAGKMAFRLVKA